FVKEPVPAWEMIILASLQSAVSSSGGINGLIDIWELLKWVCPLCTITSSCICPSKQAWLIPINGRVNAVGNVPNKTNIIGYIFGLVDAAAIDGFFIQFLCTRPLHDKFISNRINYARRK